jgi:2-dehydro-3-deoxygluconokinase
MLLLVADRPGPLEAADSFYKRSAGAETNVAIGLARLGLKVAWASRLGTDSMGRYLLATMTGEGVDCAQVVCDATQKTGFMFKGQVSDGGDPPVEYHRQGSAASRMGPNDINEAWLLSARHLHATGVFAAVSASTLALTQKSMDLMRCLLTPTCGLHCGPPQRTCVKPSTTWPAALTGSCPAWKKATC